MHFITIMGVNTICVIHLDHMIRCSLWFHLLTLHTGARWTPGHYQAAITTILIKSDMRANYIFVKSKWMCDPQWPLPGQPCCSRNRKRLCALLALGNLNNSLRCVDAIGPATCVRAVYLTVCIEEIRMWIRDKRFCGEAWGAEGGNPGSTICLRMTSPARETWDLQGGLVGRLLRGFKRK